MKNRSVFFALLAFQLLVLLVLVLAFALSTVISIKLVLFSLLLFTCPQTIIYGIQGDWNGRDGISTDSIHVEYRIFKTIDGTYWLKYKGWWGWKYLMRYQGEYRMLHLFNSPSEAVAMLTSRIKDPNSEDLLVVDAKLRIDK